MICGVTVMPASVHRTLADGMTILGLPGKIGNANIGLHITVEAFLILYLFQYIALEVSA